MTFQQKYAEKRQEAQKILEESRNKINVNDCADIIFKAIQNNLDEKVGKEYDAERIKKDNPDRLENQFHVKVNFYSNCVKVAGEDIDVHCNILVRQEEVKKILTKKLREVGVDFRKDLGDGFYAELVFENKSDG